MGRSRLEETDHYMTKMQAGFLRYELYQLQTNGHRLVQEPLDPSSLVDTTDAAGAAWVDSVHMRTVTRRLISMFRPDQTELRLPHLKVNPIQSAVSLGHRSQTTTEADVVVRGTLYGLPVVAKRINTSLSHDLSLHEVYVGLRLNQLRSLTPCFVWTYGGFRCGRAGYVVTEAIDGAYLGGQLQLSPDELDTVLDMLLVSLRLAEPLGFIHQDLHPGNIMIRTLPEVVTIEIDGQQFQTRYIPVIIDFGRSQIRSDEGVVMSPISLSHRNPASTTRVDYSYLRHVRTMHLDRQASNDFDLYYQVHDLGDPIQPFRAGQSIHPINRVMRVASYSPPTAVTLAVRSDPYRQPSDWSDQSLELVPEPDGCPDPIDQISWLRRELTETYEVVMKLAPHTALGVSVLYLLDHHDHIPGYVGNAYLGSDPMSIDLMTRAIREVADRVKTKPTWFFRWSLDRVASLQALNRAVRPMADKVRMDEMINDEDSWARINTGVWVLTQPQLRDYLSV